MPLLNIVGVNGLGDNFHVGFAFLSAEKERDYLWAIQELKTLMRGKDITDPKVVITDRELVLMNALAVVFPNANGHLCLC